MDYKQKVITLLDSQELSEEQKRKLKEIFPELAESEDERIRKEIINYLSNELHNVKQLTPRTNEFEDWIAYLEREKEQQPAEWSKEDEKYLNLAINIVASDFGEDSPTVSWLKSLRPQPHWKPSEEQMAKLIDIVATLRKNNCDDIADFLASLYHDLTKL